MCVEQTSFQRQLTSRMVIFAAKVLSLVLLVGSANAKLVSPLEFSQFEAPCPPVDYAGVAAAPVITEKDDRFASFERISENFEKWMNLSINPCEDFYGYTCRKGQMNNVSTLSGITYQSSLVFQLEAYDDDAYFANAAKPLKQFKHLYDRCVNSDATTAAVAVSTKTKFEALMRKIGVNFPMLYQTEKVAALSADNLANLIGVPIGELGSDILVSVVVYNDLKAPDEINSRLYVDQPSQMFTPDIYANWTYFKPKKEKAVKDDMNEFAATVGVTLDQDKLKDDASAVAEMDYALRDYVTDVYTRRNYERFYNLQTIDELQKAMPAYNWINLLKAALIKAQAPELIIDELEVVVKEPEQIAKLSRDIAAKKFDPTTIANYVYYRVLVALRSASPPVSDELLSKTNVRKTMELEPKQWKEQRIRERRDRKQLTVEEIVKLADQLNQDVSKQKAHCIRTVNSMMPRAADRVYIDKIYPTPESRANMRQKLEEQTKWIFSGFRTQINQISWMTAESKRNAYKKMDNIQLNILYAEWVTDDDQLTEFYSELQLDDSLDTIQSYDTISEYMLTKAVENFRLNRPRDRAEFTEGSASTVDMSYNPLFNSINIFAGVVQHPAYDLQYPVAFNFGFIGTIIGHELTHGFDDQGIQTDYIGALNNWMDDSSYAGFKKMASCVVEEYGAFCPTSYFCIDGVNTQGENIADNGGLVAAHNAFQYYEAYYGPDPRLPGFGSKFSNDQLFFLGFANAWCNPEPTEEQYTNFYKNDPHTTPEYRVFGAIQNFPAFRAAFNCPIGSAYAPKDHCDVWTSPPGA